MLSVVLPVYNEAQVLPALYQRLVAALDPLDEPFELLFVDDGSQDASVDQVLALRASDERVGLLALSRNFGHQTAITAGVQHARGDAVVVMDADLQDPPELVPALVARWRDGYDVVYAVREDRRGESLAKRATASLYYRLLARVVALDMPIDAGDFRLLSRRVVDALRAMPERHRYVRGMVTWVGFQQTSVAYTRDARFAGTTKYPLRRMVGLAVDGVVSFSAMPLRLATGLGFVIAMMCIAYAAYASVQHLVFGRTLPGWASTVVSVSLLGAVQLLCMGIIGEYVGRIYEEVKQRPLFLVREHLQGPASGKGTAPRRVDVSSAHA